MYKRQAFSRAYGGDPKAKASCDPKEASTANAATTATKTRVLVELKALAAGAVPAAGATRQLACALGAGILHAVGEVSDAARDAVDDALVAGKLRWMLDASDSGASSPATTDDGANVLTTAAARCAHSVATRMLAIARCNAPSPDEAKLRAAHDAFILVGTLVARGGGRIPGQSQLKLAPSTGDPAVYVHSQRASAAGVVNGTTPKFDHPAGLVGKTHAQIDSSRDVGSGVLYDATGFVDGAFKFAVNVTRPDLSETVRNGWFADPDGALVDVVAFMYDDGWAPFDIDASMESELNARDGVKGAFGGLVFGVTGSWVDVGAGRRETARTSAIFGVDQARTLAAKRNLTDPNTHLGARWYDEVRREWTAGEDVAGTGVFVYTSEPALLLFARDAGAGLGFSFYAESSIAPPPSPPSPPPLPSPPPFEGAVGGGDGGGGGGGLPPIYSPVGLLASIIGGSLALYGAVRFYFKFRSQLFKARAAKDDDPLLAEDIEEEDDAGSPKKWRVLSDDDDEDDENLPEDEKALRSILDAKSPGSPESPSNDDKYASASVVVAVEDEFAHDEYM